MYSPLKVGNVLLRSRFYASSSKPHSLQGPETWPAEGFFRHYLNKAKNGAAYVTMSGGMVLGPPVRTRGINRRTMMGHFPGIDVQDSTVQNYICQLADGMHFYGAKACMMVNRNGPEGTDVDDGVLPFIVMGDGGGAGFIGEPGRRITEKEMRELTEQIAEDCVIVQDCGFDMVYMHSAYRLMLPSRFLSKRTNTRTDEFGGCMENRARFLFMICDRIKERCGKDFPIEVSFTAFDNEDPDPEKWWTLEDTREFVNLAKGHIDILQIRPHSVEYVHNMGFEPPLPTAEAAKAAHEAANGEILISSVSGYNYPELAERALDPENGYLDLVGMTRAFITNPEWDKLCREGDRKNIVPCIKCNKCHRNSYAQSHMAVCSVNPLYGREHRIDYLKQVPEKKMHLAIVGGGPAGMRAAMFATKNGHKVTLFEKSDKLGGRLNINEDVDFKWPIKDYNHWLQERTLENPDIEVKLNTAPTAEELNDGTYDEVLVAIGADPIIPDIPGIEGDNVMFAGDVYGNADKVADKVVIIGGGDIGVETGFYLNRHGKETFIIEMREELMLDATPIHYRARYVDEWNKTADVFKFACNAQATEITSKGVKYVDADGEHFVEAGTILYSVGMQAREQEALDHYQSGMRINLVGDCRIPGNIQTCNKDAFDTINSFT